MQGHFPRNFPNELNHSGESHSVYFFSSKLICLHGKESSVHNAFLGRKEGKYTLILRNLKPCFQQANHFSQQPAWVLVSSHTASDWCCPGSWYLPHMLLMAHATRILKKTWAGALLLSSYCFHMCVTGLKITCCVPAALFSFLSPSQPLAGPFRCSCPCW